MTRSNQKRILMGLAFAFGVLVFVSLLMLANADRENQNVAWVAHTRDVLDKIDELLTALEDAEAARRGYVLSGRESYCASFTNQVEHAFQSLEQIRQLTADNARQTEACDQLRPLIRQRLTISTNSILARQEKGLDVAAQTAFMEQGQGAMELIRQVTAQMSGRELTLLKGRRATQNKNIKGTEGLGLLLATGGLGTFATLFVLFWRAEGRRREAEEGLERTNQELELRVKERTAELSQSEQKLEKERNRLRTVIDNVPASIDLKDTAGRYVVNNLANVRAMKARSEAETVGKNVFDFFPEPMAKIEDAADRNVLTTGEPIINREVEGRSLDGDPVWLLTTKVPLRDSQGRIDGLLGIAQDITERKRSEEVRTRFALIVESSDDAIFSKTLDGIITSWNPGAERLFGYSAQEAIGKSMLMLMPAEIQGEESQILAHIRRGEALHHFETQRLKKNGAKIDVSLTISPIRDSNGQIVAASKIARDITHIKEAERKLRAQLARLDLLSRTTRAIAERQDLASIFQVMLRSLEDHLPIDFGCVCLYEPATPRLNVANVGTKSRALGEELAMGENARIEVDQNGLFRCVHGELVYEPDVTQIDYPFPQRLAKAGLNSMVIAPMLVESQVFGVLVAARRQPNAFSSTDCEFLRQMSEHVALASHQAQLYTALQEAYDELRKTQQATAQQERLRSLGQMASGIAHDINNAISPAALYTEFLLANEPNLSIRARDYLQTISSAIDDVAATVVRMREFYRPREPQLTLAPLQLNDLVDQVLNLTRARWNDMPQQRGIVIQRRKELAKDLPSIMGVDSEIRDALTNLILNAVDAMPEGGILTVRTRIAEGAASADEAEWVCVEVNDTGVGMDEETKRRCLEPFFSTKGERGTGLGLAMVYGMAQRHSAEIEIESEPGKGTTVRLSFVPHNTQPEGPDQSQPVRSFAVRQRILVVDDDPMLLKSLCDILEGDGHVVVTANAGQAGIDAFAGRFKSNEPFDVVITDLGMPYLDGRKVAAAIKGISPSTPIILLTGWGHRLKAEGEVPENVELVLSKPPKLAQLRDALEHCARPKPSSS